MENLKKTIKFTILISLFLVNLTALNAGYTAAQATTILLQAGYAPNQITNLFNLSGCANTDPVCAENWHSNIQNQVEAGISSLTASNASTLVPSIQSNLATLFSVVGFDSSSCPVGTLGSASQVACYLDTRLKNAITSLIS